MTNLASWKNCDVVCKNANSLYRCFRYRQTFFQNGPHSFVLIQISPRCLVPKRKNSKEYFTKNEATRANLNKNQRILKWRRFLEKKCRESPTARFKACSYQCVYKHFPLIVSTDRFCHSCFLTCHLVLSDSRQKCLRCCYENVRQAN